jgi:hypothetical protein
MAEHTQPAYGRGMTWIRRASVTAVVALGTAGLLVPMPAADAVSGALGDSARVLQRALPDTEILEGPPTETKARKARFVFAASPGATFTCALDTKAPAPCTSPYKVKKLKVGRHKVTITATDATGTEASPAKYKWKVIKKSTPPPCTGECR